MPNLSFSYLSKSIWKDRNSVKKLKELWRQITHTYKGVFISREALCLLSSALLYPVMGHILSYHIHHTRHRCQNRMASTGRGSACIPLLPYMWAPPGCFKVQFNSPAWFGRITFLLLPCRGWCLLPALSHCTQPSPAVQQPPSQCAHTRLHLLLLLPSCPPGGVLPSALDKSSSCPAREVMAKASLLPLWALPSFEWT